MATIQQRSGKYRVLWRLGGRSGHSQSVTVSTLPAAQQAAAIAEAHKHLITADDVAATVLGIVRNRDNPELPTVAEWADRWLNSRTQIAPSTIRRYRQQLRDRILPHLGRLRLDEVTGEHIAALINSLRADVSPATVTRYYSCLHAMLEYAVTERKIADNPSRRTDFIRDAIAHDDDSDDGDDHVYLTIPQFEHLCTCADPFAERVIRVLANTGLRWSEATAVQVKDVDPFKRTLRVHRAWIQDEDGKWKTGATKGRKRRTIGIGPIFTNVVVIPLIAGEDDDKLLLRAKRGGRIIHSNFRNRYWEPAVDAAMRCAQHPPVTGSAASTCNCPHRLRKRPTLHDLRHSHVAWLIADGKPMFAISRRVGHSTMAITEQVYAAVLPEVDEAIANAADVAMGAALALEPAH